MLKYIELKSGFNDDGPAWIGRVSASKSGKSIYFDGKSLGRGGPLEGGGNYFEHETGDSYWVSGVKKDGSDHHWAGGGKITIEADAVAEYLALIGASELDPSKFEVSDEIRPTDISRLHEIENSKL